MIKSILNVLGVNGTNPYTTNLRFTGVASSDVNTLDTYEEGTFNPGLYFGGATVGVTYASRTGAYTKIGNVVFFSLSMTLTSKGTSTGSASINNIGFVPSAAGATTSIFISAVTSGVGDSFITTYMPPASGALGIFKYATGTATDLTNADFTNTSIVRASGIILT
jgi:hypothetical protein